MLQLEEIERCLQFPYRRNGPDHEPGPSSEGWFWHSKISRLTVRVLPDLARSLVTIFITDEKVLRHDRVIAAWLSVIRLTGNWQPRLSRAAGESMVLAQRRPECPKCGAAMLLRSSRAGNGQQFFGCSRFPGCNGTRSTDK